MCGDSVMKLNWRRPLLWKYQGCWSKVMLSLMFLLLGFGDEDVGVQFHQGRCHVMVIRWTSRRIVCVDWWETFNATPLMKTLSWVSCRTDQDHLHWIGISKQNLDVLPIENPKKKLEMSMIIPQIHMKLLEKNHGSSSWFLHNPLKLEDCSCLTSMEMVKKPFGIAALFVNIDDGDLLLLNKDL